MRHAILLAAAALALAGCASTNVKGPKAYRVWCNTDRRYLSEWLDSKEAAQKIEEEHRRRWGMHATRIDIAAQADVADRLVRSSEAKD